MSKSIGEKIKKLRIESNFTQEEMAKMLNIKRETIHKYENGIIKNIKYETVTKLAEILKTTPEYLLGLKEKKQPVISREHLTKENMAFFEADDISEKDKDEMFKLLQEFYFKQKYEKKEK